MRPVSYFIVFVTLLSLLSTSLAQQVVAPPPTIDGGGTANYIPCGRQHNPGQFEHLPISQQSRDGTLPPPQRSTSLATLMSATAKPTASVRAQS